MHLLIKKLDLSHTEIHSQKNPIISKLRENLKKMDKKRKHKPIILEHKVYALRHEFFFAFDLGEFHSFVHHFG
jgi:hypothetical protein